MCITHIQTYSEQNSFFAYPKLFGCAVRAKGQPSYGAYGKGRVKGLS